MANVATIDPSKLMIFSSVGQRRFMSISTPQSGATTSL